MFEHGFRKYEIIKLLNDIKKRIKQIEESVPTQIDNAINQLLDGAPEALDTLKELADALGNNPNFLTELNDKIDNIIPKEISIPSGGFEPNRFYELGEITQDTTFTLKTPTNNNILNKYTIQFSIGSTVPNITWPSNIKWENGSAPTINANKEYLLKVINNLAQIKEF